ncbi:hypothetical protein [Streptomyces chiangmaiensis]|uniref:hypothetical protein n=1 Tax=Streptomyces chiangmaiensis TaxID=766497 RepID=UPI0031E62269
MRSHPWTPWRAEVTTPRFGTPRLVLRDPSTDAAMHLKHAMVNQPQQLTDGLVWWCATPGQGGVLSAPGGGTLTWAVPLRRGRRRARFRWILLSGLMIGGLGIAGSEAADHDPMVELTVIDGTTAPGPCKVRFKDPFTGERRTGAFACEGHRDPLIPTYEVGWAVSYGPWKEDLYNADWDGTAANSVNDAFLLGGLLLTLTGGVGGAISRHHRKRYATAPDAPPRTPLSRRAARASLVWVGRARRTLRR